MHARRRQSRALPWLVAVIGLLALLGVWSWYASRPALVWYVSPALDAAGHRIRVLQPVGWEAIFSMPSPAPTGDVLIEPRRDQWTWMPHWMRFGPFAPPEADDRQWLSFDPRGFHWPDKNLGRIEVHRRNYGGFTQSVERFDKRHTVACYMVYGRSDSRAFDATHSAICNSLRIE